MTNYLYIPDNDSEYGPVWPCDDQLDQFTAEQLAEATDAELVVSLDGTRGHYLAASYLAETADLMESATLGIGTTVDLSLPENFPLRDRVSEVMRDALETSDAYERHQSLFTEDTCQDDGAEPGALCSRCEYISDDADAAESVLSDLGYVTEWNDGVRIFRVSDGVSDCETVQAAIAVAEDDMSDGIARMIVSWWHGGQSTAAYAYASSGTILPNLDWELQSDVARAEGFQKEALASVRLYLAQTTNRDANTGWICTDCFFYLVNGDLPAEMSEEECDAWKADIARNESPNWHEVPGLPFGAEGCNCDGTETNQDSSHSEGCETIEFTRRSCDSCGSPLGGKRYAVTYMPVES